MEVNGLFDNRLRFIEVSRSHSVRDKWAVLNATGVSGLILPEVTIES